MPKWIYSSIHQNRFKSLCLLILFPVLLFLITNIILTFSFIDSSEWIYFLQSRKIALYETNNIFLLLWPIIIIWWVISFFFHRQIIFKFAWAKPITRKENPEIYNIVENLCISKWLATPKIWIIEDNSLNAFATWWNVKNGRIVFSRWLLNKLNKSEIEAVAWHELTHILNKDSLMMIIIVVFVWIIGTLGQILIRSSGRSSSDDNKSWGILILIWFGLLLLWYLIYPLIRLALSRKREYLADAGSVELTKDKYAMISALQKISQDPIIESIQKDTVAAMCIENPFSKTKSSSFFRNLLSTHPSIEDRVKALENY